MRNFIIYKKQKRLYLKNKKIKLGGEIFLKDAFTNPFNNKEYELFNPIYGSIMCNINFFYNIYYFGELNFFEEDDILYKTIFKNIKKMCIINQDDELQIHNRFKTMDIEEYVDFIKYTYDELNNFCTSYNELKNVKTDNYHQFILQYNTLISTPSRRKLKSKSLKNFKSIIHFLKDTEDFKDFNNYLQKIDIITEYIYYLVLFCFWKSKNDINDITNYYNELKKIFNELPLPPQPSQTLPPLPPLQALPYPQIKEKSESFEEKINAIIKSKRRFILLDSLKAKAFVYQELYPDCGEITALNFINLICYDFETETFNINLLPTNSKDKLIEFYEVFKDFSSFKENVTKPIYGKELNFRDAWSYLIIEYANHKCNFVKEKIRKYELNYGMNNSEDNKCNFFQLIENLLNKKITDIENKNINNINIDDINDNCIGTIKIEHKNNIIFEQIIIELKKLHFHMKIKYKPIDIQKSSDIESEQKWIDYLLNDITSITKNNLLYYDLEDTQLINMFKKYKDNKQFIQLLFKYSLINKYTNETRSILKIKISFINKIMENLKTQRDTLKLQLNTLSNQKELVVKELQLESVYKNIEKCSMYEYIFDADDIMNDFLNKTIFIGRDFNPSFYLFGKKNLTFLAPELNSIGEKFLASCKLESLTFANLSELKYIGDAFLKECYKLESLTFTNLSKLESIGDNFLYNCNNLQSFTFKNLPKLESIGDNFLSNCKNLQSFTFTDLPKLKSIGKNFLSNCRFLKSLTFENLPQLESIGDNFLYNDKFLKSLTFTNLPQLESIGDDFLYNCEKLQSFTFTFTDLSELKFIGHYFLCGCSVLSLTFENLPELKSIGHGFLMSCEKLESFTFENLPELKSIGKNFLSNCRFLKSFTFTKLNKLESIGEDFLSESEKLQSFTFTDLPELKLIGHVKVSVS